MVRGEVGAKLQAGVDELLEGEGRGTLAVGAGLIEQVPGLAEVVVLIRRH